MVMFFFDEAGELEEYQTFRKKDQPLEMVYLEIRVALNDAEAALQANPGNEDLEARLEVLKKRLAVLEQEAPWLTFDYPVEYMLWGPPHG